MKTALYKRLNAKTLISKVTKDFLLSTLRLCRFASLRYVFMLILFAGCVPARVPENLDDTPGPAVVVTDRLFENSVFTVRYPQGWRIVTGEAGAPPSVIFVAPDEQTTIRLQVGDFNGSFNPPDGFQIDLRQLDDIGGESISAVLTAPTAEWEGYLAIFERVLASVQAA